MRRQKTDRYVNQSDFERVLDREYCRLCCDAPCEHCRRCDCRKSNPCGREKPDCGSNPRDGCNSCDKEKPSCSKREKSCRLSCKNEKGELEISCNEDYRSIGIKLYEK